MLDRFRNLTEEQLNVGVAIMGALCVVMLFIMILMNATPVGAGALAAIGLGGPGEVAEPTPTPGQTLPPTWTPRATNTATPTVTPRPTETETPTPDVTETPEAPLESPTSEVTVSTTPDYAATIEAAQSSTPVAPPAPPSQPAPRPTTPPAPAVPVIPPVAAPPVAPTVRPPPTETPLPTATPLPLYVLAELLGGPNCTYSGISGTVRNNDGSVRSGTVVEVFNESGYKQTLTTDAAGFYEAYLDNKPREDLKGFWHIRVMEDGIQGSNEIVVIMSGTCTEGETQFVANFYRSR